MCLKPVKLWVFLVTHFTDQKELVEEGGIDSLIDKSRRKPNLRNRVDAKIEQTVIDFAFEYPARAVSGL